MQGEGRLATKDLPHAVHLAGSASGSQERSPTSDWLGRRRRRTRLADALAVDGTCSWPNWKRLAVDRARVWTSWRRIKPTRREGLSKTRSRTGRLSGSKRAGRRSIKSNKIHHSTWPAHTLRAVSTSAACDGGGATGPSRSSARGTWRGHTIRHRAAHTASRVCSKRANKVRRGCGGGPWHCVGGMALVGRRH